MGFVSGGKLSVHCANGNVRHPKIAPVVTNTGLVQLPTNNYTALIGAVATVGPVSISVAAGSWSLYFGGVYTGSCDYDMDHAVQLVGYGEDSGKLYWLVRNSWGSGWGESGYIRMERFGEGSEPCAILRQVRYPLCVQLPYRRERSVGLGGSVTLNVNMFFARETLARGTASSATDGTRVQPA